MAGGDGAVSIKLVTDKKIAETSSKGNQEKWLENGKWYKLDQFGYEALAEVMTSRILEQSNIERDTPFTFVRYEMQTVKVHGFQRTACVSRNFLQSGQSILTVNALFRQLSVTPLIKQLGKLPSDKRRMAYLASAVSEMTGLADFDKYLALLFEIDALILNDDRHLNNIAVLEENGRFLYCPIFDNGAGLLSNMQTLRADIDPKGLMKSLTASPFQMTFNRSLSTSRTLFGSVLKIPQYSERELKETLSPLLNDYPQRDRDIIADRVIACIMERQKHY